RGRDYGLRALEVRHPGFSERLRRDPVGAVATVIRGDQVAALYWLAAAWGLWISESKDSPDSIADQPIVEALIDRALLLDESFEKGAIHGFLITYEMIRRGVPGDPATRSRMRYERAHALAGGQLASNHVALAEAVSQPKGDKRE